MTDSQRPNLLFIFTDQQRLDTLACYGNPKLSMPTLNRLSEKSVIFEQPHCTQPVCTPSRGSLMTGLWPHMHGATNNNIPLDVQARCLPELLSADTRAAYRTAYMGKWHLGDEIFVQHGFDVWSSIEDNYLKYYSAQRDASQRSEYHHFLTDAGFRPDPTTKVFDRAYAAFLPEPYSKPQFLGSEASRFIRENHHRPWMLYLNFLEPHPPLFSSRDHQYDPQEMELPENFDAVPTKDQPSFLRRTDDKTTPQWREIIARYWGLNSLVDTHVGRVLCALDQSGQRENTIIVFTSDHGDMMGSHRLSNKAVMFKEATRVPLLMQLPNQQVQGRISGPVSHIDLVPTLLDLLGEAPAAATLPGRSLAALCRNAATGQSASAKGVASPCVIEWNPGSQPCKSVVRTLITHEQERYSYYFNGEQEYYDLQRDPAETCNLAYDPNHQLRIRALREQLAHWQQQARDTADPIVS